MKHSMFVLIALISILSCKKDKKASLVVISTTDAKDITANSAKTGGNITDDGGSAVIKRGVCWALAANPTVGDSITNDGSGTGTFASTLSNLHGNTNYFVRAYAINGSGTSYGNEVSFKTAPGLATLSTSSVSDIAPLSAKAGGKIQNNGGASIIEKGVVYSTTPNPTVANFKIVSSAGSDSFGVTLTPLASQQSYYVRAYAVNSYGTAYGNEQQFKAASANTITDVEGNVYSYVTTTCGKQWTTSNLKATRYRNGDTILNASGKPFGDWINYTNGAYTYPNGNLNTKDSLGLLYNKYAINDSRGVCPAGWHVPSDDEWKALEMCYGMSQADADETNYRGTIGTLFLQGGVSGINFQKAGYLLANSGPTAGYKGFGDNAWYWSSTAVPPSNTNFYYRGLNGVNGPAPIYRQTSGSNVMGVRCVKD